MLLWLLMAASRPALPQRSPKTTIKGGGRLNYLAPSMSKRLQSPLITMWHFINNLRSLSLVIMIFFWDWMNDGIIICCILNCFDHINFNSSEGEKLVSKGSIMHYWRDWPDIDLEKVFLSLHNYVYMTHLLNFGMAAWMLHEILVKAQQLLQLTWVLNFTQLCMGKRTTNEMFQIETYRSKKWALGPPEYSRGQKKCCLIKT